MRALITRPQEDAADLAAALHARGIEPLIEPLLQIKPVPGASIDLDQVQAVLFTSANGVRAFAALSDRRDLPAFTVGDKSAETARSVGFSQIESAGGDVNALASLVGDRLQPQNGVLFHAAGSVSAGDFANFLNIARRSVFEVANMLSLFAREGYWTEEQVSGLLGELEQQSRMILAFRRTLKA